MNIVFAIIRSIFNAVTYGIIGMKVSGAEYIPKTGAFILVANHASYFDPPLVGTAVRHRLIHFMAKEELFRNPLMNWFLRLVHTFPVRRGRIDSEAVRESFRVLRNGEVLGIFPEGTSKSQGLLGKFHEGFASIAIKAGVPVLPAAIVNSRHLPKKTGPVQVIFHKPVIPPDVKTSDREAVKAFSDDVRSIILHMLEEAQQGGMR